MKNEIEMNAILDTKLEGLKLSKEGNVFDNITVINFDFSEVTVRNVLDWSLTKLVIRVQDTVLRKQYKALLDSGELDKYPATYDFVVTVLGERKATPEAKAKRKAKAVETISKESEEDFKNTLRDIFKARYPNESDTKIDARIEQAK